MAGRSPLLRRVWEIYLLFAPSERSFGLSPQKNFLIYLGKSDIRILYRFPIGFEGELGGSSL
jgi:hypothetical protein